MAQACKRHVCSISTRGSELLFMNIMVTGHSVTLKPAAQRTMPRKFKSGEQSVLILDGLCATLLYAGYSVKLKNIYNNSN